MRWQCVVLSLLTLLALSCFFHDVHAAEPLTFHKATLDNGLTVIVAPNHQAPVISHNLLFFAGAADDPLGASGVAHYLEHLLFKGTKTVPEGEYNARIEAMGGQHNAYTSADMTGYYVMVAKKHLPEVMALEADRMMHLAPSAEAFAKEREVILEERRLRVDTQPAALLGEMLDRATYPHHPYGIPIIGWAHEMAALDETKARAFLNRFYSPQNAVLLLVGDITKAEALRLAKEYYGDWQGAPKPQRNWVQDPPKRTASVITLHDERVQIPRWHRQYPAPSLGTSTNDNEIMPLLFLEELLGNNRTGWLYRILVKEQKLAVSVSAYYNPFSIGQSSFAVSIQPANGVSMEQITTAYEKAITAFLAKGIDNNAIQRARNQMKASGVYARDSLQGMAFLLAQLVMIGLEPEWLNRWESLLEAVTTEQIMQSAKDTLAESIAVTGYLLPATKE